MSGRKRGDIEMYDSERYFTVTGQHLEGAPTTIEERTEELAALHARIFGEPKPSGDDAARVTTKAGAIPGLSDSEIIEKAHAATNGAKFAALWQGDTSGHSGDDSAADSALCEMLAFWTGRDAERIDRLFRQSGLYRKKWDSRRGDSTYGQGTIDKALGWATETYTGGRSRSDNGASPDDEDDHHGDGDHPLDDPLHLTDLGNAKRLVRRHGKNLRHCTLWGKWLVNAGSRWRVDDIAQVARWAKDAALAIYGEAGAATTGQERKAIAAWATTSESQRKIEAMLGLAASEEGIPVRPDDLDADPWLFNCQNGTIDLRTGDLRPHRHEDLITKLAPVKFDPDAECPTFTAFLNRIMGGTKDHISDGTKNLITYLQRTLGRSLTGDVSEHRLEIWHGVGANGKSTLMHVILDTLGDYARMAAPGLLLGRHNDRHPTEVADLKGARFVGSVEVGENRKLAEELVKQLTGGDKLKARFMRQDFWEFEATHKLVIACNHKPNIRGSDHAIWRRVKLVPFTVVIPDHEQDKKLGAKLKAERSGILNWLIQGCLDWRRDGLTEPDEVKAATATYRAEQDTIAGFIDDCCSTGGNRKAAAGDIYAAYSAWCKDTHEEQLSKRAFGLRLSEQGFTPSRTTGGKRWWFGLGLVTQDSLFPDTK